MGQYRLSFYLKWQIGLLVKYKAYAIVIKAPFFDIIFATTKDAHGFYIFGWSNETPQTNKQFDL